MLSNVDLSFELMCGVGRPIGRRKTRQ